MTSEEALKHIADQLGNLLANLKEETRLKNEAKTACDQAHQRAEELENSDVGLLDAKLKAAEEAQEKAEDDLASEQTVSAGLREQIVQKDQTIESLNGRITALTNERDTANNEKAEAERLLGEERKTTKEQGTLLEQKEKEIDALQNSLNKQKEENSKQAQEHATEVGNLITAHKTEVDKLNADHKTEVDSLNNAHKTEIDKLNNAHKTEVDKLNSDHKAEVDSLNNAHKTEVDTLTAAHHTVQTTLDAEAAAMRECTLKIAAKLADLAKEGEIVKACDSDYDTPAQEKNQEMARELLALRVKLERLPEARTPSEWIGAVTAELKEQMEKKASVINRLLKYYCLSTLPYMIDEQRDNGMYFNRKQIKAMYATATQLLAQCGITVEIPTLFAEKAQDDDYETENTFNDVETFCPGSVKDHTNHVERDTNGIIVGVARIGYTLPDGTKVKTQVIV